MRGIFIKLTVCHKLVMISEIQRLKDITKKAHSSKSADKTKA